MKKLKYMIIIICLFGLVGCTNKKDIMKDYATDYYNKYMQDIVFDKYVITIQMLRDANKKAGANYNLDELKTCSDDSKVTLTVHNEVITKYKYELNCN